MNITKKDYLEIATHFETETSYYYDRYEAFCVGYRVGKTTQKVSDVNCKYCLKKLKEVE